MTISEQVESIEEMIGRKIDSKMKPIYWAVGIMLTIFITISVPLTLVLIDAVREIEDKASKVEIDHINSELKLMAKERERDYLKKQDYYLIEEDEHRVIKEILKNPEQADYLMGVINDNILKQLGFNFTTRGVIEK